MYHLLLYGKPLLQKHPKQEAGEQQAIDRERQHADAIDGTEEYPDTEICADGRRCKPDKHNRPVHR